MRALTLHDVAAALRSPAPADALFGPLPPPGAPDEPLAALRSAYRRLAAVVHPDRHPREVRLATEAFRGLEAARAERERAILDQPYAALPGPPGRHSGAGLAVRRPAAPSRYDVDPVPYEEPLPPPPPCACIELARASLPWGRVVFFSHNQSELAVRESDRRAVPVAHSVVCWRYRCAHPRATSAHSLVVQEPFPFAVHMSGWAWNDALVRQPAVADPFDAMGAWR